MFIKLWLVSYKILTRAKCGGSLSPSATLPSHRAEVRCSPHRRSPFRRLGSAQTRIEPKVVFSVAYRTWASLVAQRLKHLPAMQETWVQSLGQEDPLEKEMATHSSILAQRIPWTEEPGGRQSTGPQTVGHH